MCPFEAVCKSARVCCNTCQNNPANKQDYYRPIPYIPYSPQPWEWYPPMIPTTIIYEVHSVPSSCGGKI